MSKETVFNMKKFLFFVLLALIVSGCRISSYPNLAVDDPHLVNKKMGQLYNLFAITEDSTYFYKMKKVDDTYWGTCSFNARITDSVYQEKRLVDTNQPGDIVIKYLPGLEVINDKGEWESPSVFLDNGLNLCKNPKKARFALVKPMPGRWLWLRLTFEDSYGNTIQGIPEDVRVQFTHRFNIK